MAQIAVASGQKYYNKRTGQTYTASAFQDIGGGKKGQFVNVGSTWALGEPPKESPVKTQQKQEQNNQGNTSQNNQGSSQVVMPKVEEKPKLLMRKQDVISVFENTLGRKPTHEEYSNLEQYIGLEETQGVGMVQGYARKQPKENFRPKIDEEPAQDGTPTADVSTGSTGRYRYVKKGNTSFRVDATNLKTWADSGYTEISKEDYEKASTDNVPVFEFTPEMEEQTREELSKSYGEYFDQILDDFLVDATQEKQRIEDDQILRETRLLSAYGRNLQSLQEGIADRGLTFSGIRNKREKVLKDVTLDQPVADLRRTNQRRFEDIGRNLESQAGTAAARSQGFTEGLRGGRSGQVGQSKNIAIEEALLGRKREALTRYLAGISSFNEPQYNAQSLLSSVR